MGLQQEKVDIAVTAKDDNMKKSKEDYIKEYNLGKETFTHYIYTSQYTTFEEIILQYEEFKKKTKCKEGKIGDLEGDEISISFQRNSTKKEISDHIKEIKQREEFKETQQKEFNKNQKSRDIKEFNRLKKKLAK